MALPPDPTRTSKERAAGNKAASKIQTSLRREALQFNNDTGNLRNIAAKKRMSKGELRAIVITSANKTRYPYMLNYGFTGTKINGVNQRLKASNFIGEAVLNNNAVEVLATEISDARADQVVANIAFSNAVNPNRI